MAKDAGKISSNETNPTGGCLYATLGILLTMAVITFAVLLVLLDNIFRDPNF